MSGSSRKTISAILIVQDEQDNLESCLSSLAWVDEIIIVDSGSTDQTESIAKNFTSHFYVHDDWQGFGKQKQRAQSYATCDWILAIDADERVTPELRASIEAVLERPEEKTLYQLKRLPWVFGRFLYHSGWYDRVIRLYPRTKTQYDDALVHEKIQNPDNWKIDTLEGDLLHYTYKDLQHYLVKSAGYAKAWADGRQARGKRASILQGFGHALGCFLKMYVLKRGFLDGKQGFLIAVLSSHSTFVKYADLWIRNAEKSKQ